MEECELMNSNFYILPPANLWNVLPSGAVQEVRGDFYNDGRWRPQQDVYSVLLPYNDKGTAIRRSLGPELALNINWEKVNDLIIEKWRNNKISSAEIETKDILEILVQIDAATLNGAMLNIKTEYQMFFAADEPFNVVDITDTANPRKEEKK